MSRSGWIGSILLLGVVGATGYVVWKWKMIAVEKAMAAAASQPEQMEAVTVAAAKERDYRRTTTAIGTVVALRSITLKNEVPGMVRQVALTPGQVVDKGAVLVALDTSVEEAELKAQEAQLALTETVLKRARQARQSMAVPEEEVDRARAERDVAMAQIARTKAVIARKTIRAPFRAVIGLADVHQGQYLNEGSSLTTLQGVDSAVYVDFTVAQWVAANLHAGDRIDVFVNGQITPLPATLVALDARIDATTRNAMARARVETVNGLTPGAAVRVRVPVGPSESVLIVPASALRRGPAGDHVFVFTTDGGGKTRARKRRVESGAMIGDDVVIHSGLTLGERVAALGSFKLRDDVLVAITEPGK